MNIKKSQIWNKKKKLLIPLLIVLFILAYNYLFILSFEERDIRINVNRNDIPSEEISQEINNIFTNFNLSIKREYLNQSLKLYINITFNLISNNKSHNIYNLTNFFLKINNTHIFEYKDLWNDTIIRKGLPLSYGHEGIEDHLNKNPPNIGNHRISPKDLVNNQFRSKILKNIIDNPGIHNNELLRQCNLQKGQLQWHLQILVQYGLIKKKKKGQFSLFFPSFISYETNMKYDLLIIKSKTTMKVLNIIENNPGINPSIIASELDISRSSVKYHVNKLTQENIVSHRRKGKNVELYLNGDDT